MALNWGGFAQGFAGGLAIGNAINSATKEYKINKVREEGIAEATAAREADIQSRIRDTTNAQNVAPQPTGADQPGPQTGQMAPDTANVQTQAVIPQSPDQVPPAMTSQGGAPAIPMPAPSAPQQGAPNAPPAMPQAQGIPSAQPMPDMSSGQPPAPVAAAGMPTGRYQVNGQGFEDPKAARKAAEKEAPSMTDFMIKTMVPKMQQAYIAQGDIEKSDAWGKWAKDKKSEQHMEDWAGAYRAAQAGDFEAAAKNVFKLYQNYDDGITPLSHESVKDKDGNVTGFNVKTKIDATGEEKSQFIDKKALTEMGLAALSPVQMFEQVYKRQSAADTLTAKAAIDAQNDARTAARTAATEKSRASREEATDVRRDIRESNKAEIQHKYKLEEITTEADLKNAGYGAAEKAKLGAKLDLLRNNGISEEGIKDMIPTLIGADGHKKTTDPTERRALVTTDLMKNDPSFAREKDPVKQAAKVDQIVGVIYGKNSPAPAKPAATPAAAPAGKTKGVPVFDPVSGGIVFK